MQTNLGTKSFRELVTKRSNGFGYTNLDHSRSHEIEKILKKNGLGPFSYKFLGIGQKRELPVLFGPKTGVPGNISCRECC